MFRRRKKDKLIYGHILITRLNVVNWTKDVFSMKVVEGHPSIKELSEATVVIRIYIDGSCSVIKNRETGFSLDVFSA